MALSVYRFFYGFSLFILICFSLPYGSWHCGSITHMEIAFRAMEYFSATFRGIDLRQLAVRYPDALYCGAVFPDSYYSGACYAGRFHSVSEDAHWMKFIATSLTYFNEKYQSKPIDTHGERLLTFILGIISHDVADVLWHSLGIDQGFIDTMAQLNFQGDYQAAHTVADPGGDVVNMYELDFFLKADTLKLVLHKWYVPVDDILNIFRKMGISSFNTTIIKTCAIELMQLEAAGELQVFNKLYPIVMSKSPFLGSQRLTGGINEMSYWTMQRWMTAFLYLESNGTVCRNTGNDNSKNNPFYWICGNQSAINPPPQSFLSPYLRNLSINSVLRKTKPINRRFGLKPANLKINEDSSPDGLFLQYFVEHSFETLMNKPQRGWKEYYVKRSYSMIGQALLSADVNGDGYEDLIVGVPGFSLDDDYNRFQEGRVFVLFGNRCGLSPSPASSADLELSANVTLSAPFRGHGHFGYAVTVLDFNDDALLDIAVSAPSYSPDTTHALYAGQTYIYYGRSSNNTNDNHLSYTLSSSPNVTIDCKLRFCNFGTTLSTGDVNRDGKPDLIIGSPYATQSFSSHASTRQNGMVAAFFAHETTAVNSTAVNSMDADVLLWGSQPYSWFGYSIITTPDCGLLVGAPAQNVMLPNKKLAQMAGKVYCYDVKSATLTPFAEGQREFSNFGVSLSVGNPLGKSKTSVVAIGASNDNNIGKQYKVISFVLHQSGSVYLFWSSTKKLVNKLAGDRHFGAFGRFVQINDLNNDGFDDILVGSPVRQPLLMDSKGGEAVGTLFAYFGADNFPENIIQRPCKTDELVPCPKDQADRTWEIEENKAQFGSNAAVFSLKNKTQIVITAQRSDGYTKKQNGKLVVFEENPFEIDNPVKPFLA